MAHLEQRNFLLTVKNKYPEKFKKARVLDIGSLDINGNNRYLFEDSKYLGIDIGEGNNVDVVVRGHEFKDTSGFDIVISTECFEHDEYWQLTIANAIKLLRPGGLLLFTCATTGRPEHGTRRSYPGLSPFTSAIETDYYKNLTEEDFRKVLPISNLFKESEFSVHLENPCDLYFWGIKRETPKIKFMIQFPDSSYYLWQVLVQINNFKKWGYDVDTHYMGCVFNHKMSPALAKIIKSPDIKAHFHLYADRRKDKSYSASMKPWCIAQYFKQFPEEKYNTYIYLDPDLIFLKPIDWSKYNKDDVWYESNTSSYLNSSYIKCKGEDLFKEMCDIVGIDPALVESNDNNCGGAQYVTKNNTYEFWREVEEASVLLYKHMVATKDKYHPADQQYPIQAWTAEMWATNWVLWKYGGKTKTPPELDFHWADHSMKYLKHEMFHNAGVTKNDGKFFAKTAYQVSPFNKELLGSEDSISYKYIQEIKDTEKNYPDLLF